MTTNPANDVSLWSSNRNSGMAVAFLRTLFLLRFILDLFGFALCCCGKQNNTKEVFLLVSLFRHRGPDARKKTVARGMLPQFTKREVYRHQLNALKPPQYKP